MSWRFPIFCLAMLGCRREDGHTPVIATDPTPQIEALRASCHPEDWATLILIASEERPGGETANGSSELRALHRCRALAAVGETLRALRPPPSTHGVQRRFASAFSDSRVVDAIQLRFATEGSSYCGVSSHQFFGELLPAAPVQRLRSTVRASAPSLLEYLDADREAETVDRLLELDAWAAQLTPDGFARVLDALSTHERTATPSQTQDQLVETHAIALLGWLASIVASREPALDCAAVLRDAIATKRLGAVIDQQLAHPNPEVRRALLYILSRAPRVASRARIERIAREDREPLVREAATWTLGEAYTGTPVP